MAKKTLIVIHDDLRSVLDRIIKENKTDLGSTGPTTLQKAVEQALLCWPPVANILAPPDETETDKLLDGVYPE